MKFDLETNYQAEGRKVRDVFSVDHIPVYKITELKDLADFFKDPPIIIDSLKENFETFYDEQEEL